MSRLWLLVALAALTHHHPVILALAVLATAGAVTWCAIRSYRSEPQVWTPPALWSGVFA